jgi:ribulose-5-phosphate 4-epimerase/fuculose-1-phosphate aldolase
VVGPTVPQAFSNIYRAELACKAQLMAMAASTDLVLPSDEVIAKTNHLYRPEVRRPFGVLEWPALLRKLDRIDPTYRD